MVLKRIVVYESPRTEAGKRAAELISVLDTISDTARRLAKRLAVIERQTARKEGDDYGSYVTTRPHR